MPFSIPPRTASLSLSLLVSLAFSAAASAQVPFQRIEISANAGDVKLVGDIDLDGTADVVLGGRQGEDLHWYHYPDWTSTRIAVPSVEFSTDGAIADVDGDGDLDLVVPDGSTGVNLAWFANPTNLPNGQHGDPFVSAQWQRRTIGTVGSWCKDVELADFDSDGRLDVAARHNDALMIFFQDAAAWSLRSIPTSMLGNEGLASGDIDGDASVDLVVRGAWLRNPGNALARDGSRWTEHVIAASGVDANFKALVADLDADGRADVLYSSSEGTADIAWHSHGGTPQGTWTRHLIVAATNRAHTLQVADMDGDGDNDVVVGQMHTAPTPQVRVYYNTNGRATAWQVQLVDQQYGIHNGVVADIDGDGDFEIIGSNWTGNPPLQFWENRTPQDRHLLIVPELVSPSTITAFVTHATPSQPVWLFLSVAGVTTPFQVPELGATFALLQPFLLAWAPAGGNGAASFELAVPAGLGGLQLWFQSCELGRSSEAVAASIR